MFKIKFLIDENVDFPVVRYLRDKGLDVSSIAEDYRSLDDVRILKIAYEENRILLTSDKDFGSLVFKLGLKSKGLILFRLNDQSSKAKIKVLEVIINNYLNKLLGSFIVVSEGRIRIRKL